MFFLIPFEPVATLWEYLHGLTPEILTTILWGRDYNYLYFEDKEMWEYSESKLPDIAQCVNRTKIQTQEAWSDLFI